MKHNSNITITLVLATIMVTVLSFVMPKNKEKYLCDRFWTQKTFAPAVYDIVIMGDSRIYRGISPEIMEKILPEKNILNFGYSDGGLNPDMFKAAENKISQNSRNPVIVLGVTPNSITGYSMKNVQFWKEKTRPREDIFERLYLNGMLYYFSATSPEAISKLLKNKPSASYYLNEYYSNGYVESEKFPVDTMEAIPSYISDYTNYKVEERYVVDLIRQVKIWNDKGIMVVGFRPPVSAPMHALEDTMGLFNEAAIRARFKKAGGLWIDFKPNAYKTYDGSHLNKESAQKLSNDLAVEIRKVLKK
jgi:hypothetical protein